GKHRDADGVSAYWSDLNLDGAAGDLQFGGLGAKLGEYGGPRAEMLEHTAAGDGFRSEHGVEGTISQAASAIRPGAWGRLIPNLFQNYFQACLSHCISAVYRI